MELELDLHGPRTPAAGAQWLHSGSGLVDKEHQAEVSPLPSARAKNVLLWFTTGVLYAVFLGLGMAGGILGPMFQDLATNVNQNISDLSLIFVGANSGVLCASMISGILLEYLNHFLLLALSTFATAGSLYVVPFCKTATLLIATMSVCGVAVGVLIAGANILILALWGDQGAPHMQALHFSIALGEFLGPILVKVALGTTVSADNHTEPNLHPEGVNRSLGANPDLLFAAPDDLNLLWAYASVATYIFVVSVLFFALFFKESARHEKSTASAQASRRAKHHKALLCLLFVFFFFYAGVEVSYGSYLFSFATTHVGMEESEAAGVNSIFWGTFAACRGLAIFFATCLQPGTMIVLSNIGSLLSSLFLVLFDKSPLCLWIASSMYGASIATTFPSGFSWLKQYTSISGKSAAILVFGSCLGNMAIPAVTGNLQGQYPDLPVLLYMNLGSAIFTVVLFPVMHKLATSPLDHSRKEPEGPRTRNLSLPTLS